MRTVTNCFIVNLSFADVLVTITCLPASLVVDITETWFFGNTLCKILPYLQVRRCPNVFIFTFLNFHFIFKSNNISFVTYAKYIYILKHALIQMTTYIFVLVHCRNQTHNPGVVSTCSTNCATRAHLFIINDFQYVLTVIGEQQ